MKTSFLLGERCRELRRGGFESLGISFQKLTGGVGGRGRNDNFLIVALNLIFFMTQISLPVRLNQKESLISEIEGFNPVRLALWLECY